MPLWSLRHTLRAAFRPYSGGNLPLPARAEARRRENGTPPPTGTAVGPCVVRKRPQNAATNAQTAAPALQTVPTEAQTVTTKPPTVPTEAHPAATKPESVPTTAQPVATKAQTVATAAHPATTDPKTVTTSPRPVTTEAQPVTTAPGEAPAAEGFTKQGFHLGKKHQLPAPTRASPACAPFQNWAMGRPANHLSRIAGSQRMVRRCGYSR